MMIAATTRSGNLIRASWAEADHDLARGSFEASPSVASATFRPPFQALAHANVDLLAEEVALLASHADQ